MPATVVRSRLAAAAVYALVLAAFMLEKIGQTTTDTKASLMVQPTELLRSTFSLWSSQGSLGELQNQAYGYLFPMGPFFAGIESLGVPDWVTQRLWSWVVVVLACEGARLVCRQLGLNPWAALGAGFAFGLNVRMLSEVGVRSAEVLPTAVLPWMLLPVIWALRGRIDPRLAALWSVAAYLFSGAVNGTATIAPLPLIAVFIIWGARRGLVGWSMLGWWSALVALASVWWASALVQLGSYSPPFFDYVEDARTTTTATGFDASVRGASNWVGYLTTAGEPSWPAAWSLNYEPILVVVTGLIGAISLVGLAMFRSRWRIPLLVSATIGLTCLTIGHTSELWMQSPLASTVQSSLDQPFALLRNVAKIDPILRLPMAIGFGVALSRLGEAVTALARGRARFRAGAVQATLVAVCLLVVAGAQPVVALNVRAHGWDDVPSYWAQTARYLEEQPGQNGAWVVPGAGFGIQTWGWTMDEPMSLVARSPWVTRSQAPLAPAESIRMLSSLEGLLESGSGSARLGGLLKRLGLGFVVVRRDLDPALDDGVPSNLVSTAIAKSSGLRRVVTFGTLALGPAIEIYEVIGRDQAERSDLRVFDAASLRTISSGPADVLASVAAGLLDADRPAAVAGDPGATESPEIIGDGYQLRERQFGRVHANEGPVLALGEPHRAFRRVENYPGSPTAVPVVADYHGVRYIDASSSQGYADNYGPIQPESAPYAAVDGDPETEWTTAFASRPLRQWLQVHYDEPRTFHQISIAGDSEAGGAGVRDWRVSAGATSVLAHVDPSTGVATADLGGARAESLRIGVAAVGDRDRVRPISIREIAGDGLPVERSLIIAPTEDASPSAYLFSARPETRACVPTLLGPDCDPDRFRAAEESTGIDRIVTFAASGRWSLDGVVVARTDPSTVRLLDPFEAPLVMRASSTYYDDPTVSPRMAYDATPTTSWIANANDPTPTLTVDFAKRTRVDRIDVTAPASPGVVPLSATLVSGTETREVDLDGFGQFKPLLTKHLEIRFANPTRPGEPIGLSEVRLGSRDSAVPFEGEARTGVGCGFGPSVFVDSQRYLTKVEGLMGDVAASGPLTLSLCEGPIPIAAGQHRIRIASTVEFQPVRVLLSDADRVAQATPADRTWTVLENAATSQKVQVAAGGSALLATSRNWNKGWVATLDGKRLRAQRVDGWAQGWQLPAGAGGVVKVSFEPQNAYRTGLIGGLALAVLLLVVALGFAFRTRLLPASDPPGRPRPAHSSRTDHLGAGAIVVGAAVLAGLPGLVGVLVARVPGTLRRWRLWLAGGFLGAASLVTAIALWRHGPGSVPDSANALAAIGAVLALVSGFAHTEDAEPDHVGPADERG